MESEVKLGPIVNVCFIAVWKVIVNKGKNLLTITDHHSIYIGIIIGLKVTMSKMFVWWHYRGALWKVKMSKKKGGKQRLYWFFWYFFIKILQIISHLHETSTGILFWTLILSRVVTCLNYTYIIINVKKHKHMTFEKVKKDLKLPSL